MMDAQSLHKHTVSETTKPRLRVGSKEGSDNTETFFRNEKLIKDEIDKEELDQNGDGVVSLMEELDSVEDARISAEAIEKQARSEEELTSSQDDQKIDSEENVLPQAAILGVSGESQVKFNPDLPQSAPAPTQKTSHKTPVAEAKPVKDNTTAIIMILLIAILIIAVAIFCAVVLRENHNTHSNTQQTATSTTTTDKDEPSVTPTKNNENFAMIIGTWVPVSDQKSCFDIDGNGLVSWHASCADDASDYYFGQSNIFRGSEALNRAGINIERVARMVGLNPDEIELSDVYYIVTTPDELVIDGQSANSPEGIRALFVLTDKNEAHIHDYRYNELYISKRKTED